MERNIEYDELTINERQKGDKAFFTMLDSVRHGCLTDETIDTLKSWEFKVLIQEKYKELEMAAQQKEPEKKIRETKRSTKKTPGLEAVLSLAVSCRVMLRRNFDETVGLVNGAIRTVMGIYATRISIKFDHIDVPCDIKRVTSRFMLSKNLYIHWKQFPLILFYAITIHKC
uniref:DNA helicase Pif1-like 2B domain-containing protein n=1 Tax=Amphimedon queenslandica TaxID=400682 RepID=A0A1X7VAI7_AMPQE